MRFNEERIETENDRNGERVRVLVHASATEGACVFERERVARESQSRRRKTSSRHFLATEKREKKRRRLFL